MLSKPVAMLETNSLANETLPLVAPTGFREYDARWLFGREINLLGMRALGLGIGTLIHEKGVTPEIVTGHDFRNYSMAIKDAMILGLVMAGCRVHDIGLAVSPMAYFAQFALDVPAVAMVTASHNENGWTGVKIGLDRPLTLGPADMARLRDIVLGAQWIARPGGSLKQVDGMRQAYIDDLVATTRLTRRLKVIAACGNGTAGAFAPEILRRIGCDVVELDCELDHSFPRYNPNPEDLKMLHAMADAVRTHGADLALGFDGDGDRCGIVDNEGHEIFADKIGVMLARDLSDLHRQARFVVDVKSTSLFATDPLLLANGATTEYWKTGHSYMKSRTAETGALAGFEKSGHYFFGPPYGRGYDDGFVSALAICRMLDRAGTRSMADLYRALPRTWGTPTMSPHCGDTVKYGVIDRIVEHFSRQDSLAGRRISQLITVNGIRIVLDDGSWGLVRASSNKPELVVVCESPVSEAMMRSVFGEIAAHLKTYPEIGAFNQSI
ncbi:MAG: phosphomannomutase/phosphoglucomutase [Hyphomicrobiales bacterium]